MTRCVELIDCVAVDDELRELGALLRDFHLLGFRQQPVYGLPLIILVLVHRLPRVFFQVVRAASAPRCAADPRRAAWVR